MLRTNTPAGGHVTTPSEMWDCYHSPTSKSCRDITPKDSFGAVAYLADETIPANLLFSNIGENCVLRGCVILYLAGKEFTPYVAQGDVMEGARVTDGGTLSLKSVGYIPSGVSLAMQVACTNSKVSR